MTNLQYYAALTADSLTWTPINSSHPSDLEQYVYDCWLEDRGFTWTQFIDACDVAYEVMSDRLNTIPMRAA